MEVQVLDRIRKKLVLKRREITQWVDTAPENEITEKLGEADQEDLQARVAAIDEAIMKSEIGTLGICEVCHGQVDARLLEADYTACVCLDHFTEAEKRNLEYELELAQGVQRVLLTHQEPDIPGIDLASFSRPAQIIGGDYFDILRFQNGRYALVIADVAGHGVSASLFMASLQTALRTLVPNCSSPSEVMQKIHHLYSHNIHFASFVTIFLAAYDPDQSSLTYINAGHNPPLLLYRGSDLSTQVDWLAPTGAAIGLVEEPEFEVKTTTLHPGDLLVMYTDGVTEAVDQQELFGRERLAHSVLESAGLPARGLVESLWHSLQDYTHGQPLADDTTIVAMKMAAI